MPGTSEFLPDELALVLNCSRSFATGVLSDAYLLTERMPAVWEACATGGLDWWRARVFADVLGTASDEVVEVVVPSLLPAAAGLSSGRLRRRLVAAAMAAAMWSVIDGAAQLARTSGDDRPIGVLRAEAHAALVLRPVPRRTVRPDRGSTVSPSPPRTSVSYWPNWARSACSPRRAAA